MTTETETKTAIISCPLSQLREAKYNPRHHFDEKQLAELVESVKAKGVLNPILVRPMNDRFEIVGGTRRFRAARSAGLSEIPCIVRELSDQEALEVAVIDNLQRADVHPLDEAEGYVALLEHPGYDVAAIAAKVGKSQSYVYQRLKLAELIEPAKKAFWKDELTAGHAVLIARLQPKDQEDAFHECFHEYNRKRDQVISVRDLAGWIRNNITLDLNSAPWKKDDATLVAKAGACTACPKRTGNCAQLFPEISEKDVCTDRGCFQSKAEAFIARRIAEQEAKGKKVVRISDSWQAPKGTLGTDAYKAATNGKTCKSTKFGIFVDGPRRGSVTTICTGGYDCKTHSSHTYSSGGGTRGRSADEEKKHQAELHKERIRVRARTLVFKAAVEAVKKLDRTHLNTIASDLIDNAYGDDFDAIYEKSPSPKEIEKLDEPEFAKVLVAAYLAPHGDDAVIAEAKRQKVNVAGLQKLAKDQCDAELALKERQKKWKNRVASQSKTFDLPTCTGCGCTPATACMDPGTLGPCKWMKLNEKTNAGTCSACAEIEKK
jgi:ParB family chromosome partitioning protein